MSIKLIIIIVFSYLYAIFEISLTFQQKKKVIATTAGDKGSLWILYGFITLGYILAFTSATSTFGRIHHWNILFGFGFTLVMIGLAIRVHAISTLRQHFTYSVEKIQNHKIIQSGLYRYIRHPGYLGQLLIFNGISISLSNWLSVLLMLIPVLMGYFYRMSIEEKFMSENMGDEYEAYKASTKRLIPMIY
jgi:protein-S-isoprenylcysteine O-methyltransferase